MKLLVNIYDWTYEQPVWLGALVWGLTMGVVVGIPLGVAFSLLTLVV